MIQLHVHKNKLESYRTNFEGDWDEICPHCGKKQFEHKKSYGPIEGRMHEHRLPCEPELEKYRKEHRKVVRAGKLIVTGMELFAYGISKIPFLSEIKVTKGILNRHFGHKLKTKSKN